MSVEELFRTFVERLGSQYGVGEAKAMARLVFHHLKGWDATALVIHGTDEASEYLSHKVYELMSRIETGEPIQYVLGEARFYGMNLKVAPGVLIPRPETAELVDLIVRQNSRSDLRVLDVGTGSGAIAIALSRNLRFSRVTAIDISETALAIARQNAANLHAKIDFRREDIFRFDPPRDSFDIIVSNPPYIAESERSEMERNVLEHEPPEALFVPDENPLVYYSRIAEVAANSLSEDGCLYFEINPRFAEDLRKMLESNGFRDVEIINDSFNRLRMATAICPQNR